MSFIRIYFTNGNLFQEYYELNGKEEGEYKLYYSNGQLWIICNYVNGMREGAYIEDIMTMENYT